jgi:hypothetical protein
MNLLYRFKILPPVKKLFAGIAVLLFSWSFITLIIQVTNAQRGIGAASFFIVFIIAVVTFKEKQYQIAYLTTVIWLGAIIIMPGLYRHAQIFIQPVYRDILPDQIEQPASGIFYWKDSQVAKDMTIVVSDDHEWHTYSQKTKSVISTDSYHLAPLVSASWKREKPVKLFATHIIYDKHLPSSNKFAINWLENTKYNAGIIQPLENEIFLELIQAAKDKFKITIAHKPVLVYLMYNPYETSRQKFFTFAAVLILFLLGWIFLCLKKPDPTVN